MHKGGGGGRQPTPRLTGFSNFINSIITDRVRLKEAPAQNSNQSKATGEGQQSMSSGGDLSLIQQIQEAEKKSQRKGEEYEKSSRSTGLKNIGLGYDAVASKAEVANETHIQRLKNQIRQQNEKDQEINRISKSGEVGSRHEVICSKKQSHGDGERGRIMQDRKDKKREKKERQKAKKVEDDKLLKQTAEQKQSQHEARVQTERDLGEPRMRKRTKTRSKQKNKKKDNRPIEVKRAKLAEKGIII